MRYPVRLFLGNEEVEFSAPPDILFNYSETELVNPTIVKNSYSKTITIEGTKHNNQLFGHIYNLERIQGYNGSMMGSAFNPLVKTDFTLYYNSSIYESGYFKLDEVRRNNNNIEYDISLYGGLGDFFYNLSFREDGTSMELSDLYLSREGSPIDIGFKINKEAVKDAWLYMWQYSSKWDTINFAPCLNGKPENIAADKFLINNKDIPVFSVPSTGYSIGTSDHEHTEWETFDLRSYLQRPVIRVHDLIDACCNPVNNGGYTVNLDSDFFKSDNPYWWDSWMTLPLLPNLDIPATIESALTVSAITLESGNLYKLWDGGANATNVQVDVNVNFTPSGSYSGDSVFLLRQYNASGGATLQSRFVKYFTADSQILIQMLGYNESGQISTVSNVYRLITPTEGLESWENMPEWMKENFENVNPATDIPGISNVIGKFTKKNGNFVFTDMSGNTQTLRFTFPSTAEFTKLKLKILPQYSYSLKRTFTGGSSSGYGWAELDFWSSRYRHSNSWQDESIVRNLDKVNGSVSYSPVGATGTTVSFEGFYSNREYTQKDLLTLGVTPAQFLLSYAKLFGLYFIKDVENKEITILTRHNFYKRDEIVNINDLIDKGSDINIIPNSPKYQYYDFALEQVDSEAAESYRKTYGSEYGTATVNTGYQYEKEHKKLLDGNIFKAGINVIEKNKYFQKPTQGIPCLVFNGFSYRTDEVEYKQPTQPMSGAIINPDGLKYYGFRPMPQFHTADNEASDGSMVLLFCTQIDYNAGSYGFKLTDDLEQMYTLNDGQPCWIITSGTTDSSGNTIALELDRMPMFSRDDYPGNGYIRHSFDLGTPMTTYVPNIYVSDWQSIYSKAWKSYLADLYDVNTRVLKCRCLLRERPNPDWMRRFYWFDNSYWRLNSIKDWDISSHDTTEMEFIKVEDISNYDNVDFSECPIIEYRGETYIDNSGGTIDAIIYVSDGTSWTFNGEVDYVWCEYSDGTGEYIPSSDLISPVSGYGTANAQIQITIPANTSGMSRKFHFTLEDGCDRFTYFTIQQGVEVATITPTSMSFTSYGESMPFTITDTTNVGWEFTNVPSWITLSSYSGTGSTTVTATASTNTSSARTQNMNFVSNGNTVSILMSQAADQVASVSPSSLSYGYTGGTATLTVSDPSRHGWTLNKTGTSWLTLSQSSGTGSTSVTVTASANASDARSSIIVFQDDTRTTSTTISVTQAEAEYAASISPTAVTITYDGSSGGRLNITDRSNHGWRIEGTIPSWLTLSRTSGTGSSAVTMTAIMNDSSARTVTLTFVDASWGDSIQFTITQRAFVRDYLAMDIISDGTIRFWASTNDTSGAVESVEYSKDDGNTWTPQVFNRYNYINVSAGETVLLRMNQYYDTPIMCNDTEYSPSFSGSTATFDLRGNIMSLLYRNFEDKTEFPNTTSQRFQGLFKYSSVRNANNLKLPTLTLVPACYRNMFYNCTSLTGAPKLPATTLDNYCYQGMFGNCTSLTTSPELPAATLVTGCYNNMFGGCTALNKITCYATSTGTTNNTRYWVRNVASSGTFIKKNTMNDWTIGENGIPTSWTTSDSSGAYGYIVPINIVFAGTGETITVNILDPDNLGWRFTQSAGYPDWIVLSKMSGTGSTTVNVTAPRNTSSARNGSIKFISANFKQSFLQVFQYHGTQPVTVSPSSLSFGESGGTLTLNVTDTDNVGWSFDDTYIWWYSLSKYSGTGSTAITASAFANTSASSRSHTQTLTSEGNTTAITITQAASTWSCQLDFSYGNVTSPQTATWDEYDIYYSDTPNNPVETGSLMMSIACGTIIYQGSTWNPTSSNSWTVNSPFSDEGSVSVVGVPQSLAGQTIYLRVEFGSADAGQAIYSSIVEVQIPQNGGVISVTIPQF